MTTLTDHMFTSGKVALFDCMDASFDNVRISGTSSGTSSVPEPATLLLLGSGLAGLGLLRKKAKA